MSEPMLLTVSATAKLIGLHRSTVAMLCDKGEIGFVPCLTPEGKRSRVHRRIPRTEAEAWVKRNTVRSAADFKRVVDGRRV